MYPQTESELERKCCEWAYQEFGVRNVKIYKKQGWADRIFFKGPYILFVEFKRPGEELRKLQQNIMETLQKEGTPAAWCTNLEQFKQIVINWSISVWK